jgi:hypothetical protein
MLAVWHQERELAVQINDDYATGEDQMACLGTKASQKVK